MKRKAIFSFMLIIFIMLIIPACIELLDPKNAMGMIIICFFAINPILSIVLGIIASTEIKKLWWIPIVSAVIFPLLFMIVIKDFVLDLYIYSSMYLILSFVAIGISLAIKKFKK